MSSQWKTIRHRSEWLVVWALAQSVPWLPRWLSNLVADFSGAVATYVHWPARRVALSNLEAAFGAELSLARKCVLVRQSYQYFARAMGDLFWSPRLTRENLFEIFEIENLERFREEGGFERGTIFACLHYGSFEWISHVLGLLGCELTVVTQAFKNPLIDPIFNHARALTGHRCVRREGAMLRLYRALRDGRGVSIAVDLTLYPKLPSVPITCFGLETCVTFAHAWLHERTGAPIIPTHCEPLPGGRQKLVLHPKLQIAPGATHQQIAQACWDRFEPVVRRNPAPWLWMYKHWRYKPPAAQREYPFYANESSHFRKLLARTEKEKSAAARGGVRAG